MFCSLVYASETIDTFCDIDCGITSCLPWPGRIIFITECRAKNLTIHMNLKGIIFHTRYREISGEVVESISTRWHCERSRRVIVSVNNQQVVSGGSENCFILIFLMGWCSRDLSQT